MMNKIGWGIYIGDELDAVNAEALKQNKIGLTVDLTNLPIDVELTPETVAEVNLKLEELDRKFKTGHNVLVFCRGGVDRAPFVVALYYSRTFTKTSFRRAYELVLKNRPQTIQHWDWYEKFRK